MSTKVLGARTQHSGTGVCPVCEFNVPLTRSGNIVSHKTGTKMTDAVHCVGSFSHPEARRGICQECLQSVPLELDGNVEFHTFHGYGFVCDGSWKLPGDAMF